MAAKTASLSVNIIADAAKAKAGLREAETAFGKFRTSVGQADGAMGKFRAGAGSAFDAVKANALGFAAAAGAALAAFAVKSVMSFQNLALASGKFADSTGLSVEQASRFIEVAGDLGIQTGTIEGAFNKLNRAVASGSGAFKDIGAEIVRTSSGAVDVQKTFLNVVDALNNIKDPAARAKAATELLGKGWTEMSELIAGGSAALVASLKSVSDSKVVDEEELAKAKRFRDSLDDLKGAGEDLALSLGESLIPALTDFVEVLVAGVDGLKKIHSWFKYNDPAMKEIIAIVEEYKTKQEFLNNAWREGYRAQIDAATATKELTTLVDDQKRAVDFAIASWNTFKGSLEFQNEFAALQESTSDFEKYWADAMAKGVTNTVEVQTALRNNQLELMAFAEQILVTASVADRNRIRIKIETGEIMTAIQLMNDLLSVANAAFAMQGDVLYGAVGGYGGVPISQPGGVYVDGVYIPPGLDFSGFMADGGLVNSASLAVIGEAGAEAVIPLTDPARAMELMQATGLDSLAMSGMRGGGTVVKNSTQITVNVSGADPNAVVRALQQYVRQSGPVPVNVRTM